MKNEKKNAANVIIAAEIEATKAAEKKATLRTRVKGGTGYVGDARAQ